MSQQPVTSSKRGCWGWWWWWWWCEYTPTIIDGPPHPPFPTLECDSMHFTVIEEREGERREREGVRERERGREREREGERERE